MAKNTVTLSNGKVIDLLNMKKDRDLASLEPGGKYWTPEEWWGPNTLFAIDGMRTVNNETDLEFLIGDGTPALEGSTASIVPGEFPNRTTSIELGDGSGSLNTAGIHFGKTTQVNYMGALGGQSRTVQCRFKIGTEFVSNHNFRFYNYQGSSGRRLYLNLERNGSGRIDLHVQGNNSGTKWIIDTGISANDTTNDHHIALEWDRSDVSDVFRLYIDGNHIGTSGAINGVDSSNSYNERIYALSGAHVYIDRYEILDNAPYQGSNFTPEW